MSKGSDDSTHTVRIQQMYWVKDTSEDQMLALGAVRLGRVVEQVDYYDTDLYDLALHQMWLSKMSGTWQLIVYKSDPNNSQQPYIAEEEKSQEEAQKVKKVGDKLITSNSNTGTFKDRTSKMNRNGNRNIAEQGESRSKATACYALGQDKDIINYLSQVLNVTVKTDKMMIGDFLQRAGIQKYASITNVTQETFRMPGGYTVLLKTEGTTTKKTAKVSLDVGIEEVTWGFQRLEHLAKELDFQIQNV
ncbi:uncharacterized protein PAF06_002784 [Gastrophryne carolinensis]